MEHDAASRPDFAVGVYPAWRGELSVPADAPPLFLVISDDDASVPSVSSTRMLRGLAQIRRAGRTARVRQWRAWAGA